MSITETNKIDIVATRPDSPIVKLVITDHLAWDDIDAHIYLLQEKINTYLEFIEAGQLYRLNEPKIPESPEIRITLALQHAPSEDAKKFLTRTEEFLTSVGLKLEISIL